MHNISATTWGKREEIQISEKLFSASFLDQLGKSSDIIREITKLLKSCSY